MNKVLMSVSALLLIAVAYLFFQVQGLKSESVQEPTDLLEQFEDQEQDQVNGSMKIGYVRGDSLMLNYLFVQDEQDALLQKQTASENKLKRALKKAEDKDKQWVDFFNSGSATESDQQLYQEEMMQLQYSLQQSELNEQQKLAKAEMEFQKEFVDRISEYLERYAKENGLDLVFNYERGGMTLLYSVDAFDVTSEVIAGLNAEYQKEKEAAAAAGK